MLKKISMLTALLIALMTLSSFAVLPDKYLYITLPRDGFQDNTTNMVVNGVYDLGSMTGPYNKDDLRIKVLCPQLSVIQMTQNVETLQNSFNVTNGQGDFGFNFSNLSVGKYQVTVKVYYKDILQVSDVVNFEIIPADQTPTWQNNTGGTSSNPTTNIVTPPALPTIPTDYPKYLLVKDSYGWLLFLSKVDLKPSGTENIVNGTLISMKYNETTLKWDYYLTSASGATGNFQYSVAWPIVKSNYDVYTTTGTLLFKSNASTSTGSTSSKDTKMYIVRPRDGFKDVGNVMTLGLYFETTKSGTTGSDWSWNFTSPTIDIKTIGEISGNYFDTTSKFGGLELALNPIPFGKYTVTAELFYKGQKVATDTVNFELLAKQTDTNNDGVDDNTNLPIDWGTTITPTTPTAQTDTLPDKSKYSNDIFGNVAWGFDTLVAIISYPFKLLATFISMLVENAKMLTSAFGGASKFFGDLLKWMPTELRSLVLTVFAILASITVWKVARN